VEREAVMGGHEVDAGVGAAAAARVQVAASRQPVAEGARLSLLSLPEAADRIPVLAVPFRPQHREIADLIAAVAEVPGLGDQLDLRDHRILVDDVEESAQAVHVVQLTRQR